MDTQRRSLSDRLADADGLLERLKGNRVKPTREQAIKFVEDVRAITDATSLRPASYFLDEGCSPKDVVEHFRKIAEKQKERVMRAKLQDDAEAEALVDAERRLALDPKHIADSKKKRR